MNTILGSDRLGQERLSLGAETGKLRTYGGLETPFSDDIIQLTPRHAKQIAEYVKRSAFQFGPSIGDKEPTFVQQELGIPSLVVRVDCTVIDGEIVAYEMEDSPSGQGITDQIHRNIGAAGIKGKILAHYEQQLGDIPFVIISGDRSHGTDDASIVGDDRYVYDTERTASIGPNDFVIVKTTPGDVSSRRPYLGLQSRAVAPLVSEGDKTYLERIGDLTPINGEDGLLRTSDGALISQVVKSRIGSMAMGVTLFLTPDDKRLFTSAGTVTGSRLIKNTEHYIAERGGALVQPFAQPIPLEDNGERKNAIMRVFVLLGNDGNEITTDVIGGCYVTRQGMIVHGASDAVSGAVVVTEERAA